MNRFRLATVFFIGMFVARLMYAQTQTGAIEGTIRDHEGQVIPGVNMKTSSPSLIGGSTTTFTDRNGFYRFPNLASGVYEVQAQLAGFQTVVQKEVRVFVGKTLTVDFSLAIENVAETMEITENPPLIDESTTAVSFTIPPEIIYKLPKLQRIQDLIVLTPGVMEGDRIIGDQLSAYGVGEGGSAFLVDGVNVTSLGGGFDTLQGDSPTSGTLFGEFNYNWIEEVHVAGIGAPAEYGGFTGVSANLITRSGGNQFHGLFETFFQNEKLVSTNTPKPQEEIPFTSYDVSTQAGGPILKDRLWFFSGFEYSQRETQFFRVPYLFIETLPKFITKLTYKANENHSLQGFFHRNDPIFDGIGAITILPEASRKVQETQSSWNATWISILNRQTNFEGRLGGFYDRSSSIEEDPDLSGHGDLGSGLFSVNSRTRSDFKGKHLQLNATLSHYASDFINTVHDFRFGIEFERSDESRDIYYNGGFFYYDLYGAPFQRTSITGQNFDGKLHRTSLFIQDDWKVSDRINLSLGVRWDHNRGFTDRGLVFATDPVAPRLGFVWILDESNLTVIKAHYGDYYDRIVASHFYFLSDALNPTTILEEINAEGQWIEIGRFNDEVIQSDDKFKNPRVRQFTVGIDRVLPGQIPVGAHYIYRRFGNSLEDVGLANYEPVPFLNPLTGETITVYNLVDTEVKRLYTNPSDLYARYHGIEVFTSKQFGSKLFVSGSFVYSRMNGNGFSSSPTFFLDDPNTTVNFQGTFFNDFAWKFVGTYSFPFGIDAGWFFRHTSGRRWTARVLVMGLNQGNVGIWAEPIGSRKLESQNLLDLRVEKEIPFFRGQLRIAADIFNVLNSSYVLFPFTRIDRANFGQPQAFNPPRQIRLGIRYTF